MIQFLIALIPILWLIIALGTSLLEVHLTSFISLVLAMVLAYTAFGMSASNVLSAALEGALLGLWPILAVIISAIFTYKLALHTKSMELIKVMLSGISTDRRIQVLVLAWGFGSFLEAISGYGTSVAIPASILIALGFEPLFAAVVCLIANTVPTAYGAVGIAVTTLSKVTGLEVGLLNFYIALQLSLFIVLLPFVLVIITGKGLKGVTGITLVSGIAFVIPQLLTAMFLTEQLPTLVGSLCSLGATILWAKLFHKDKKSSEVEKISSNKALLAWLPYLLIFVFIILTSPLAQPISQLLEHCKTVVTIYTGKSASVMTFKWIDSPGTLIFLAAVMGSLIQGARLADILRIFLATFKQMWKSGITVLSIVSVARVMGYSGMIASVAAMLIKSTGSFYPFISPFIGTLGTFLTGSDTSSNILFGALQKEAAVLIDINPYWLAASNTAGATAGKMISPQNIAVATSAAGLAGYEGRIFRKTIGYCLIYVVILGVLIYVGGWML